MIDWYKRAASLCVAFMILACVALALGGASSAFADDSPGSATVESAYTYDSIDFPDCERTEAWGINNAGDIVGYCCDASGAEHGFISRGDDLTIIDLPGAQVTTARAINDAGQTVGTLYDNSGQHGFLAGGDGYAVIDFPDAHDTQCYGINDAGQIVGRWDYNRGGRSSFLFGDGCYTTIDCPDAYVTACLDINNRGQVVGFRFYMSGVLDGFLLSDGAYTTIAFPGALATLCYGMNDTGQIVGIFIDDSGQHGFLLSGGEYTRIDFPGVTATTCCGINNNAQIVGTYDDDSGTHGFVATASREESVLVVDSVTWVDEEDGMVTPYDSVTLEFRFRNDSPHPLQDVDFTFASNGDGVVSFEKSNAHVAGIDPGAGITIINSMIVDGVTNPDIMQTIVAEDGTISLENSIQVGADYLSGVQAFTLSPLDESGSVLVVSYPNVVGHVGTYYATGDADFCHNNDSYVRKCALIAGATGAAAPIFPDSPNQVADNIYSFLNEYVPDNQWGFIRTDHQLARELDLVIGQNRQVDGVACWVQAYLCTSFARTLGIPAREVNLALNEIGVGAWEQTGAAELWYSGAWHLIDTFCNTRDWGSYTRSYTSVRAWYAYCPADYDISGKGYYRGHDFWISRFWGQPRSPEQWNLYPERSHDGLGLFISVRCPVELVVVDSEGRITGMTSAGALQQIPGSLYAPEGTLAHQLGGDTSSSFALDQTVCIPFEPNSRYTIRVRGAGDGWYTLGVSSVSQGAMAAVGSVTRPTSTGVVDEYQLIVGGDPAEARLATTATVDFDPDTLNLKSKGKYVTVYIELPEGYDAGQIDISSIRLNGTVPALSTPTSIGDYDGDGVPDLMVKFSRSAVQAVLGPGDEVEITITGEVGGLAFEGGDTIRVIN